MLWIILASVFIVWLIGFNGKVGGNLTLLLLPLTLGVFFTRLIKGRSISI